MGSVSPFAPRNPLAYPFGIAPGFNPSHIAALTMAKGFGYSGVALGANFIGIFDGLIGTVNGTITSTIDSGIGPAVKIPTTPSTSITVPNQPTAASDLTIGAIFVIPALNTLNQALMGNGSAGFTESVFYIDGTTGFLSFYNGAIAGQTINSTISISINTPYFAVVSNKNSSVINFVSVNLKTGQMMTYSTTGATATGGNGTYMIGGYGGATELAGSISATMLALTYNPLSILKAWASDPWSFWYPQKPYRYVGVTAVSVGGLGALLSDKRSRLVNAGLMLS